MKHKKNYTKPLKKKEQLQATQSSKQSISKTKNAKKKVFGNPSATSSHKKRKNFQSNQVAVKETELDEETVQDILENVANDDDEDGHEIHRGNVKKRKRVAATDQDADDEARNAKHFEKEHAQMTFAEEKTKKRIVSLLPIKTKAGEVITRTAEMEDKDYEEDNESDVEEEQEEVIEEEIDSDDDIVKNNAVSNFQFG